MMNGGFANDRSAPDLLWITRCSVPAASSVAWALGWVDEAFRRDGVAVEMLGVRAEFLRLHGFLKAAVDVYRWIEPSALAAAPGRRTPAPSPIDLKAELDAAPHLLLNECSSACYVHRRPLPQAL